MVREFYFELCHRYMLDYYGEGAEQYCYPGWQILNTVMIKNNYNFTNYNYFLNWYLCYENDSLFLGVIILATKKL
jgi:hypothetical protein